MPVSTTHTITGAMSASARSGGSPRSSGAWRGSIVVAWMVTMPATAVAGALFYALARAFG